MRALPALQRAAYEYLLRTYFSCRLHEEHRKHRVPIRPGPRIHSRYGTEDTEDKVGAAIATKVFAKPLPAFLASRASFVGQPCNALSACKDIIAVDYQAQQCTRSTRRTQQSRYRGPEDKVYSFGSGTAT